MEKKDDKVLFYGGKGMSLLPLALFVASCVLFFVVFKDYAMESLCVGGFGALIIGSIFAKKKSTYWDSVVKGMCSETMGTLALILMIVGMFGKMMTRAGIANGFVWLGDAMGLSGGLFTAFAFIATCVISMATGTSIGTLFTGFPILYPSGILLGAHPVFLAGAILSGAIFGDNVAPISDTTIASASTQEYTKREGVAEIGGVVATRMKYALVAAAAAVVLFIIFGGSGSGVDEAGGELLAQYKDPKGLIMLIPVVVLLVVAVKSQSIFRACTWGILSGCVVGLVSGVLTPADIMSMENGSLAGFLIDGVKNMLGTFGYLYAVAGIIGVLNGSGMMETIIEKLVHSKLNQTALGSEIIMAIGMMVSSVCLGSANGPAIIMFGPIANDIGKSRELHPYRRANILDGFGSTLPVIIPVTSSFIFIVISCIQGVAGEYSFIQMLSPVAVAGATFHCWCLFAVLAFSVITGWGRRFEGPEGHPEKR